MTFNTFFLALTSSPNGLIFLKLSLDNNKKEYKKIAKCCGFKKYLLPANFCINGTDLVCWCLCVLCFVFLCYWTKDHVKLWALKIFLVIEPVKTERKEKHLCYKHCDTICVWQCTKLVFWLTIFGSKNTFALMCYFRKWIFLNLLLLALHVCTDVSSFAFMCPALILFTSYPI